MTDKVSYIEASLLKRDEFGKTCPPFKDLSHWLQNVLIINSWPHCMKRGREFRAVGIKTGGERVANVTRFIS